MKRNKRVPSLIIPIFGAVVIGVLLFSANKNFDIRSKAAFNTDTFPVSKNSRKTPIPVQSSSYYVKISDYVTVDPNMGSTLVYGCNDGDIAISGGLYNYSGRLDQWRTIRSSPIELDQNIHNWQLTVMNEGSVKGNFNAIVRCLKR